MDFEDQNQSSSTSSSSSTSLEVVLVTPNPNSATHKKRGGRKIFKETRHPVYWGVRRRNGSKWVCEVREPKTKSRIWLGTYENPEMAAVAHDVAVLALRGENAPLNFLDSAMSLPRAKSNSHSDIRKAAYHAAKNFSFSISPSSNSSSSDILTKTVEEKPHPIDLESKENVNIASLQDHSCNNTPGTGTDQSRYPTYRTNEFIDEEAIFNMPGLINSMAEGMLLTPPAMKKGFKWSHDIDDHFHQDNEEHCIDLNLWV